MELRNISHFSFGNKNILKGLSWFSKPNSKAARTPSKISTQTYLALKGSVFIAVGIVLSFSAHRLSQEYGADFFARSAWPHSVAWTETLKSLGFTQVNVSAHPSLLKQHPDPYKPKNNIWVRDDLRIIYLSQSPYQKDRPELWVRGINLTQKSKKGALKEKINWDDLGLGITAFNGLVMKLINKAPLISQKKRYLVDPKEIRY